MKFVAFACFAIALLFFALGHSGDNPDARALAGILYIPGLGFAALGAALFLLSLF